MTFKLFLVIIFLSYSMNSQNLNKNETDYVMFLFMYYTIDELIELEGINGINVTEYSKNRKIVLEQDEYPNQLFIIERKELDKNTYLKTISVVFSNIDSIFFNKIIQQIKKEEYKFNYSDNTTFNFELQTISKNGVRIYRSEHYNILIGYDGDNRNQLLMNIGGNFRK